MFPQYEDLTMSQDFELNEQDDDDYKTINEGKEEKLLQNNKDQQQQEKDKIINHQELQDDQGIKIKKLIE